MLMPQCLYPKDMGWCFGKIGDVIDGFERLDRENRMITAYRIKTSTKLKLFPVVKKDSFCI